MTEIARQSLNIWLVRDGEPIPTDNDNPRLQRIGILADFLVKRGHKINWIASTWDHHNKRFRSEKDQVFSIQPNYQITLLHTNSYEKNISFARIIHNRRFAKQLTAYAKQQSKPDLILASYPLIEPCAAIVNHAKQNDIPIIVELRDMWPDIISNLAPKSVTPFAKLLLTPLYRAAKKALQNADAIVGITDAFLEWGLNYANRPKSDKDRVFPLAYEITQFDQATLKEVEQFWKKLGLKKSPNQKIIAFAGSLNDTLPLDEAIQYVINSKENIKLVIAGHKGRFEHYKQLAGNNERIIFSGWINKPQIWALLKMADVGLAPYIVRKDFNASMPNKVIEYLAAGLPILGSIQGVSAKFIQEQQCGVIYKKGELAQAADQLLFHQDLTQLSQNAKATFKTKLDAKFVYTEFCHYLETFKEQ